MGDDKIEAHFYKVLALIEEINRVSSSFDGLLQPVFDKVSLPLPKVQPAELGFIRVVSWLFVYYYEAGKLGTAFLVQQLESFGMDSDQKHSEHLQRIQQLRTYYQHNLSLTTPSNKLTTESCEEWFKANCGTATPGNEGHWQKLLLEIITEAVHFLTVLRNVLRRIEDDDSRQQITTAWALKVKQYHAPNEFDQLIEIVANDLGRPSIDAVKLRKRYYDKWRRAFEIRVDSCDFVTEARKMIEQVLIMEEEDVLPIDGRDIMTYFGIPPGPQIAELLKKAKSLYEQKRCKKEELLQHLQTGRNTNIE